MTSIMLASKREALLRPMAKASYEANVGRPSKSWAILPTIFICKSCGESFDREVWHCVEMNR